MVCNIMKISYGLKMTEGRVAKALKYGKGVPEIRRKKKRLRLKYKKMKRRYIDYQRDLFGKALQGDNNAMP